MANEESNDRLECIGIVGDYREREGVDQDNVEGVCIPSLSLSIGHGM